MKLLDSGLAVIPDPDPGRNDDSKRFSTFYEAIKFKLTANTMETKELDFVTAISCNSLRRLGRPLYFMLIIERVKDD
ncbi:MAG: hypothetical protein U9N83_08120 [Thermodesulfobacteriota bacterium]|nr:hypothetical protein [Thermodesulfobacteriota bacterium]